MVVESDVSNMPQVLHSHLNYVGRVETAKFIVLNADPTQWKLCAMATDSLGLQCGLLILDIKKCAKVTHI